MVPEYGLGFRVVPYLLLKRESVPLEGPHMRGPCNYPKEGRVGQPLQEIHVFLADAARFSKWAEGAI